MYKKLIGTTIAIATLFFCIHQFQRETISRSEAIDLATVYVQRVKMHLNQSKTISSVEHSNLNTNPLKKISGTSTWEVAIDGIFVDIDAYSGQFIRMIFPTDGVISYDEHSEWFDLTKIQQQP